MPGPSPAEIEKWVHLNHPDTLTLILAAHDRDAYLVEMDTGKIALRFSFPFRSHML